MSEEKEESVRYVYKVKNTKTGQFMDKSGWFNKYGKTWDTLGKLKLTLQQAGYYSSSEYRKEVNDHPLPKDELQIITIKIVESEGNMSPLADLVARERRFAKLALEKGEIFSTLVKRIEDQGQTEQFQWVLVTDHKWNWKTRESEGGLTDILEIVKKLKYKQNKDYKKASAYNQGACIAFATKQQAMTVRLMFNGQCTGIDIKDFVEIDIDDKEDPALNSST